MTEAYRILVTGSRDTSGDDELYIQSVLHLASAKALMAARPVVVIQGECPAGGVDEVAGLWADHVRGVTNEPHPAEWKRLGKSAGMIRNGEMVRAGADICLAFPGPKSIGTWDCIRKAVAAGIHTRIYPIGMRRD